MENNTTKDNSRHRHKESSRLLQTRGRSGVDVYKIINQLGKDILYIHDKGSWYNMLDWQGVPNKHEKFGIRNVVEQMFRIVKHRLASMEKHFPASSTKETITRWMRIFFTIYNNLYNLF